MIVPEKDMTTTTINDDNENNNSPQGQDTVYNNMNMHA